MKIIYSNLLFRLKSLFNNLQFLLGTDNKRFCKSFLCIGVIFLFPVLINAQCGSENFELLIETSLATGQICENSSADVSVDVTPESFYSLDQLDSIKWDWFASSPFEDVISTEFTYPPFTPVAENSHLYDDLVNLDCSDLTQLITTPPNKVEMFIGTTGYVTCDNGEIEKHTVLVGFDLLLAPRAHIQISATNICSDETVNFVNQGCFGDEDLSFWTLDGEVIQTNGSSIFGYSPDISGNVNVCLHLINSCGEDVDCETINIVPEPNALFDIPLELMDGEGCAGTYEFCNESDTIDFFNIEYYWELYYNESLQGGIDTQQYKNCFIAAFNEAGEYELVLTSTNFTCDDEEYSFTFNIIPSAYAELEDPDPFCVSSFTGYTPDVEYFGNVTSFEWTFENGTPGTSTEAMPMNIDFPPGPHDVELKINSDCGEQTYQTMVTIDTPTNITFSSFDDTHCTGQGDTIKIVPSPLNGSWDSPFFINDSCIVIDQLPVGTNTFTYTVGSGACLSSQGIEIEIIDTTEIIFDESVETFCEDDGIIMLGGVTPTGGTWSGIGVTDPINGLVDVSIIGAGNTASIWYTFMNADDCVSMTNKTLIIEGLPEASLPQDSLLLCDIPGSVDLNDELQIDLLPGYTDEWIGDCVTAEGILDPVCLGLGNFSLGYIVFTPNGCTDTTDFTIIVETYQEADAGDDISECVSDGATIQLTGLPAGGSWDGVNISDDGVIEIDNSMNGDYIYTYTYGGANCENNDEVIVTIINLNNVSASLPGYCETESIVTLPDGSPAGGTWIYNGDPVINNELDISMFEPDVHTLQYEVQETTSNNEVCTNSVDVILFVDAEPNPIIEIPPNFCINVPDTIINNTTEVYTSWKWDFGNGTMSTELSPIIEYSSTGSYTITLMIQDTVCQKTFTWEVDVSSPPPPLDFDLDVLSADSCELLEVAFINQSEVDPNVTDVTYLWDFGNGLFDTTYTVNEAPDNVFFEAFDADTIYTITLSALNNCGVVTPATATVYVKPKPISEFSSDFEIYCSGATVSFVNSSTGNPVNTIIDLGDGTPLIYDYPFDTLTHQYFVGDQTEEITVQFISSNPCGSDTILNIIEIVPVEVVAAFTVEDNGEFCQNSPICITNGATPGATVWYDMGDGTILFASDTCYAYTEIGEYTITQFAQDICGGFDTIQTPIEILLAPEITISSESTICFGDSSRFNLDISDDVIEILWDFGDGNFSNEQNPVHFYDAPGTYTVSATASSLIPCSISSTFIVVVQELLEVSFAMDDTICQNANFTLSNTSNGSGYSCLWTIDETVTYANCEVETLIETSGLHYVSLTITDNSNGCKNTLDSFLFVRPTPSTAFDIQQFEMCSANVFNFINLSTDANTALWDFGDGATSSQLDSLEHIYDQKGSYNVKLLSSFDGICFDSLDQLIEVPDRLQSIIDIEGTDGCEPFTPNIQNQSTGNNLTYYWSTSNDLNYFSEDFMPSFSTDLPSEEITIQLIVIDSISNCADTSDITITVFDSPTVSLDATHVTCASGSDGTIVANAIGGTPGYQYDWSISGATEVLTDVPADIYTVTITDSNSCTIIDSIEVTEPAPILITLDDLQNATCQGLEDGLIDVHASGGTTTSGNEFLYAWSINQPLPGEPQDIIKDLGSGYYIVTVTDESGCTEIAEYTVEDGYAIEVIDTILGISCEDMVDGQIQIASIANGFPNYLAVLGGALSDTINSDSGIFNFKDLPAGNYTLSIIDQNNCMYEEEYLVPSWKDPEVSIYVDNPDLFRCDTALVIANATGSNLSYQWFPEVDFDCLSEDCDSIAVSPRIDITYDLKVTDEKRCFAEDEVALTVDEDRTLYIPTAFTPNGDGNNDIFRIRVGEHQEFLLNEIGTFNVLDRWGNVLFNAENFHPYLSPEIGWDGRIEEIDAPSDVYIYWAELNYCDGQSDVVKGQIQLIR